MLCCAVTCCAVTVTCRAVICRLGVLYIVWFCVILRARSYAASECWCLFFHGGQYVFLIFTYWWPSCARKLRAARMSLSKGSRVAWKRCVVRCRFAPRTLVIKNQGECCAHALGCGLFKPRGSVRAYLKYRATAWDNTWFFHVPFPP